MLPELGFSLLRPVLHRMDAEQAHGLTLRALQLMPHTQPPQWPALQSQHLGLNFPNPLGLAAGFDKNGEVPDAMLSLGFGAVEVGTVTPRPQSGNPKPRLFRLIEDEAVINRMGFNNEGHDALAQRLDQRAGRGGLVGVNIGANKDSEDRIADYVAGVKTFGGRASWLTLNVSSPNTPGLRQLQSSDELARLLEATADARSKLPRKIPLLLKIAPDLDDAALQDIARRCAGGIIDGVIVSNTTIARPELLSRHAQEAGGLSGRPLVLPSLRVLAKLHQYTEGKLTLIGAGGISGAATAIEKIEAGASLLQLYSALVFKGPGLVKRICDGLVQFSATEGVALHAIVGRRSETFAQA